MPTEALFTDLSFHIIAILSSEGKVTLIYGLSFSSDLTASFPTNQPDPPLPIAMPIQCLMSVNMTIFDCTEMKCILSPKHLFLTSDKQKS